MSYQTEACQHCGGGIEFNAGELSPGEIRIVDCPHCQQQTPVTRPRREFPWFATVALVGFVALCAIGLVVYQDWRSTAKAHIAIEAQRLAVEQERQRTADVERAQAKFDKDMAEYRANDPLLKQIAADKEHQKHVDEAIKEWDPYWDRHHLQLSAQQINLDFQRLVALLDSGLRPDVASSQLEVEFQSRRLREVANSEMKRANELADYNESRRRSDKMFEDIKHNSEREDDRLERKSERDQREIDNLLRPTYRYYPAR